MRLFLFLLFMIPIVPAASAGFLENLTQTQYVDTVQELLQPTNLQPDKTMQPDPEWFSKHCEGNSQTDCVFGWLDVLGFKNMARIGDTYYIQGKPEDAAIIQYKTYVRINNRYLFERWIYDLKKYEDKGKFCAQLKATAVLYSIDSNGYVSYEYPSNTFQKCIAAPQVFNDTATVIIHETYYNVTNYSVTTLDLELSDITTKYIMSTSDGRVIARLKVGEVIYSDKGIPYLNLTNVNLYTVEGQNISATKNHIVFKGSNYTTRFFSPFGELNITPTVLRTVLTNRIDYPALNFTLYFLAILGILLTGIYKIWR